MISLPLCNEHLFMGKKRFLGRVNPLKQSYAFLGWAIPGTYGESLDEIGR